MKKADMVAGEVYGCTAARNWASSSWSAPNPVRVIEAETWHEKSWYWSNRDSQPWTYAKENGPTMKLSARVQKGHSQSAKNGVLVEYLRVLSYRDPNQYEAYDPPRYGVEMFKDIVGKYDECVQLIKDNAERARKADAARKERRESDHAALVEAVTLVNTTVGENLLNPEVSDFEGVKTFTGTQFLAFVKALLSA